MNTALAKLGTASVGLRRHTDQGIARNFAQTGLSSYFFDTYFNASTGYDLDTLATAHTLTARRNFSGQSAFLQYNRYSSDYNTGTPGAGSALRDSYRLSLSGPLPLRPTFLKQLNYTFEGTESNNYDDSRQFDLASGLSTRYQSIFLSSGFVYNDNISPEGDDSESARMNFNGRGFMFGGSWRFDTNYSVIPKVRMTDNTFEYSRNVSENIDSTTVIRRTPDPEFISAQIGLNWRTEKATITPSISTDTNRNVSANIDVHFGLAADPYSHSYSMYNAYLSGSGSVAARIFLDKNGDGIFNDNDELMPNVQIKALQVHREANVR